MAVSLLLLTACNSDKVSWSFVSDPGGDGFGGGGSGSGGTGGGGAVIVIRGSSGSSAQAAGEGRTLAFLGFVADGDQGPEPVDIHLVPRAEVALRVWPARDRLELLCPLLPEGRLEMPSAGLALPTTGPLGAEVALADTSTVLAEARGSGRLWIGADGTLVALEHVGGVVAWGNEATAGGVARRFDAGARLEQRGDAVVVVTADQRLERLDPAPAVDPARQIARPAAGQLELLGASGRPLARIPERNATVYVGAPRLYVAADFPDGLAGAGNAPFALRVATANRYLLRIDG